MSKGFAAQRAFQGLDLDAPRELRQPEGLASTPGINWASQDEVVRIVARIRAQLARTDRILLFTDVTSGSGASELASEVALWLSKVEGGPILLLDTGVSAPSLHKKLNTSVSPGLGEAITGERSLADAIRSIIHGQLLFMPAGKANVGPATLFAAPEFAAILQVLRAEYRYVVLCAPPVLSDVSATLLGPMVDGVVLTVSAGAQRRAEVQAAQSELQNLRARVLGAVLCDMPAVNQNHEG